MKITVKDVSISDDDVSMVVDIEATRKEVENAESGHYTKPLAEQITRGIAQEVADHWLNLHKVEIMEGIDLDDILKGVKLKIVEGFSLNHH